MSLWKKKVSELLVELSSTILLEQVFISIADVLNLRLRIIVGLVDWAMGFST